MDSQAFKAGNFTGVVTSLSSFQHVTTEVNKEQSSIENLYQRILDLSKSIQKGRQLSWDIIIRDLVYTYANSRA